MPTTMHLPLPGTTRCLDALATSMSVIVVERLDALAEHVSAWEDLAATAIEPNVFFEPWMLLPAVRALGADAALRFALVYANEPPALCGFFPIEMQKRYRGMPMSAWRIWQHKHCFLGTPLLRASHARPAL